MLWPKKNSFKEFDNGKKFLRHENSPPPPPPHKFSNGPSLTPRENCYRVFVCFDVVVVVTVVFDITQITECQR